MQGQCIDLPPHAVAMLFVVAGLPTTANEQSISLRCPCSSWMDGMTLIEVKTYKLQLKNLYPQFH